MQVITEMNYTISWKTITTIFADFSQDNIKMVFTVILNKKIVKK